MLALRNILGSLDIPELEPLPRDHVLTKTFYLLREFPGRFVTGQTWVEALPRDPDDDPASASGPWRRRGVADHHHVERSGRCVGDATGRPADAAADPQRAAPARFAFRAGVNIVMYTLTGNYKSDLVHAPAMIERLGQ